VHRSLFLLEKKTVLSFFNQKQKNMSVICCDGEPPCVAFAAYISEHLKLKLVSIPKPLISSAPKPGKDDICFGSYWPDVETRFTYDLNRHDSLFRAIDACEIGFIEENRLSALKMMDDREHGRDTERTQSFTSGLKAQYGKTKDQTEIFSTAEMFVWYFRFGNQVPSVESVIDSGKELAKYIEIEALSAVDAYSFKIEEMCAIVSGPFYVGALHEALRRRNPDRDITLVIRHGFDENRISKVFYSARCYEDEVSALCYLKFHLSDIGGNARAAGGSDEGQWLEKLKALYADSKPVETN
jgi:hypothetical protein